MRLEQEELPGNILNLKLIGSLDIAGAGEIEMPFSVIAGKNTRVILDLSKVTFLASIGIRVLVKTARAISSRGGRFVIYDPTFDARKVLRSTGIDAVIPVVSNQAAAIAECSK